MARLEMKVTPWRGSHAVPPEEASVLVAGAMEIDGQLVRRATLRAEAEGFVRIEIEDPDFDRSAYGPGDYLIDSTDDVLVLPITSLKIAQVNSRTVAEAEVADGA